MAVVLIFWTCDVVVCVGDARAFFGSPMLMERRGIFSVCQDFLSTFPKKLLYLKTLFASTQKSGTPNREDNNTTVGANH